MSAYGRSPLLDGAERVARRDECAVVTPGPTEEPAHSLSSTDSIPVETARSRGGDAYRGVSRVAGTPSTLQLARLLPRASPRWPAVHVSGIADFGAHY